MTQSSVTEMEGNRSIWQLMIVFFFIYEPKRGQETLIVLKNTVPLSVRPALSGAHLKSANLPKRKKLNGAVAHLLNDAHARVLGATEDIEEKINSTNHQQQPSSSTPRGAQ